MPSDIVEVLDAVDRVAASAAGVVSDASAGRAERTAVDLRKRRAHQGVALVAALAGGTGTGKSSLLNAIAGERVASVSALRPHTGRPLAWIPERRGPGIDALLDDLGIADRVTHERVPGPALIDLPDMDSIDGDHRRIVDTLLPRVDVVVWVLDPFKYADPVLFDDYLEPLVAYRTQFVFVLNKIDLITDESRAPLVEAVRSRLADAGHLGAPLFVTAAAPAAGGPAAGVDELEQHLTSQMDAKQVALSKWLTDLEAELRRLGDEAGVWSGATVDLRSRWMRDRDAAADGVLPQRGPGRRSEAVCRLEDLVAMIAVEVGPETGPTVRGLFPEGSIEDAVEAASRAAATAGDAPGKSSRTRSSLTSARTVLDERIGAPLRSALERRAVFGAELVEAVLAVERARHELESEAPLTTGVG